MKRALLNVPPLVKFDVELLGELVALRAESTWALTFSKRQAIVIAAEIDFGEGMEQESSLGWVFH